MDENEYRSAYHSLNALRCVFEKSILTLHCGCRHHERFNLAEREGIRCTDSNCQQECALFLNTVRKHARFALHLTEIVGNLLPHSKEIQVQKGALLGLVPDLPNHPDTPLDDIHDLIVKAKRMGNGDLSTFPYQILMSSIVSHPPRQRHRRHRKKITNRIDKP
jgi:hypothetical protein